MADKRTVWSLSAGMYSDYRVLAIFASHKDAERACERQKEVARSEGFSEEYAQEEYYVEEFDYHPADGDPLGVEVQAEEAGE